MKYVETQGEQPFDWNEFLDRAIAGETTQDENDEATSLSGGWITCACGNQCNIIPRNGHGAPYDVLLWELGNDFLTCVGNRLFTEAKEILFKIEQRSAELIKQMNQLND